MKETVVMFDEVAMNPDLLGWTGVESNPAPQFAPLWGSAAQ